MAVEKTSLDFWKPDGGELVRQGDNIIAHNAQRAQDLLTAVLAGGSEVNFDGGGPSAVFAPEQIIDGGLA